MVTHWSVAQAGSNDENMGVKNLVGLSLQEAKFPRTP